MARARGWDCWSERRVWSRLCDWKVFATPVFAVFSSLALFLADDGTCIDLLLILGILALAPGAIGLLSHRILGSSSAWATLDLYVFTGMKLLYIDF